jgi:DNA mismatch endonuclease (patch repair protein)
MDKIDKVTRSRVMASVHSKNTQPEIIVRSALHRLGFRFRLHRKDLPGNPDIVLPSRKITIFVHGCFWHGHNCPHGQRLPTSNVQYWRNKIAKNTERDIKVQSEIKLLGWQSIVIWECETLNINALSKQLIEAIG